jgi:hypothetical protein
VPDCDVIAAFEAVEIIVDHFIVLLIVRRGPKHCAAFDHANFVQGHIPALRRTAGLAFLLLCWWLFDRASAAFTNWRI